MGQYHKVVNLDKFEVLHPHQFGDGLKLMEFGMSGDGTLVAMAAQLVLDAEHRAPWAGCRLTVTGDYGDEGRFVPAEHAAINLYSYASPGESDEAAVKSPYRYVTAEEAVAQVGRLGIARNLGSGEGRPCALYDNKRVFDQPEELCQALGAFPQEDLREVVGNMLTTLRVDKVPSKVSWCTVERAELTIDADGRAQSLEVAFSNGRGVHDAPSYQERMLRFPCGAKAVRDFFGITLPVKPRRVASKPKAIAAQPKLLTNS